MKENDFFFFFFFLKNLGTPGVRMQKYPKSTSTQKVSGTGTAPFLEYPCFIVGPLHLLSIGFGLDTSSLIWYHDRLFPPHHPI
jgi:hypothetical protein